MPYLLELAQLPQSHHMSQMNIRDAGVEALLEAEGFAPLQQFHHLLFNDDLGNSPFE